jgi:hypothetical protein
MLERAKVLYARGEPFSSIACWCNEWCCLN